MTTLNAERFDRKARGAFFTPQPIAVFLTRWAIAGNSDASVLDPTCGDGAFLEAAVDELIGLGADGAVSDQLVGVDIDSQSIEAARRKLAPRGIGVRLVEGDFFRASPPTGLLPGDFTRFDAVVGNPPYVRYQQHRGEARRYAQVAALAQGVRLSGLASSWAALLVHAGAFVRPGGRLAMVLPAELLAVSYAEPVRNWLRQRFGSVKLVLFEELQFPGALERVVLLLAQGSGGCDAFSLYYVRGAADLEEIKPFDEAAVSLAAEGKWTDLLLSGPQRSAFRTAVGEYFVPLRTYGNPELGTVTGANGYFTVSEQLRKEYGLSTDEVLPISPPGTKHLRGLAFTRNDWERLKLAEAPVWMLYPPEGAMPSKGLERYIIQGELQGIQEAYKCRIRTPWWRPPAVSSPDLFFTYMSHRFPRLIANKAKVSFVNSMHGVRLHQTTPRSVIEALPLVAMNSVTILGAEVHGRSYGGGLLKMEPREAAELPLPAARHLLRAWDVLRHERSSLNHQLREGRWTNVVARVDEVLLRQELGMSCEGAGAIQAAASELRRRRIGNE